MPLRSRCFRDKTLLICLKYGFRVPDHCDNVPTYGFEVTLGPPSYTEEKHKLFKAYQEYAHQDKNPTSYAFRKFLAKTPLQQSHIPYRSTPSQHMPREYGTYHQLYYLDGKLIAMAVLDILPSCISSVYFIYDPAWERYSLGKLSILREITLANEIHNAGISGHGSLYLGYYVHGCKKMKYKAEYSPSHLLDPEDYTWWSIEVCQKQLDSMHYACFSQPEHSLQTLPEREPLPMVPVKILETLPILKPNEAGENEAVLFGDGLSNVDLVGVTLSRMVHSLGIDIAREMNFVVEDWK